MSTVPRIDPNRFEDPESGFGITIPTSWHRLSDEAVREQRARIEPQTEEVRAALARGPSALVTATKYDATHATLNPAIQIVKRALTQELDPMTMIAATLDLLASSFPDFSVVEPTREARIAGASGASAHFRYSAPVTGQATGIAVEGRLHVAFRGSDVFIIAMTGAQEGEDRCDAEFAAALASITIAPHPIADAGAPP